MELFDAIVRGFKGLFLIAIALIVFGTILLLFIYFVRRVIRGSFSQDKYLGLSSETFDLSANIENDNRSGLDNRSKFKVLLLMLWYGESFDEARTRYVQRAFSSNNIAPDGRPRDPKAVFFA
ncbi:hypothetical protein B9G98_03604 [Wickerhamiella sorbophila]|uniref:Uncharacterized protein n=1 Tax=Wickerhamiella sorbophila TaxID=45607 RepID=A0A2T0FLW9_9ASCO|nr:hypothetical protein B9G98_03604 [Wickerhamiella sorbophila]PRT55984.1 hypothetical protein B9G98_03604 [Wickerhamiella sorbophila]